MYSWLHSARVTRVAIYLQVVREPVLPVAVRLGLFRGLLHDDDAVLAEGHGARGGPGLAADVVADAALLDLLGVQTGVGWG